jgi:hypothetical protein
MATKIQDSFAYAPRGMEASRAAAYCGLGRTKFFECVESGLFPVAKNVLGAPRWDRVQLDEAWDTLVERKQTRQCGKEISFDDVIGGQNGEHRSAVC